MSIPPINKRALNKIPGWLTLAAQVLTELLIDLQRERDDVTGVLELGVYKGKYLSLLSRCVQGLDVPVVGIDAFLERPGKKLIDEHRDSAEQEIHNAIVSMTGGPRRAVLIASYTRDLDLGVLADIAPNGFSFISVDAGHEADDLITDMAIASRVLSPNGIAAIDDVYNQTTPGVGEGFFEYFHRTPEVDLVPFATGGNKVFMSRRKKYNSYLHFALSIAERAEICFPLIARTTSRQRENRSIGWAPRLLGFEVVPFVDTSPVDVVAIVSKLHRLARRLLRKGAP